MYNLIEYSDNYLDSTASLYHYKRQEQNLDPAGEIANLDPEDSSSFKYKSNLLGNSEPVAANTNPNLIAAHRLLKNAHIFVPLKYISNFFRKLELILINTELYIELNKDSVTSDEDDNDSTKFQITKTELYVPAVTLKTNDNTKLKTLLAKIFKRLVFWNENKSKIQTVTQAQNDHNFKRILLDSSFQGVNRLLVMGFNDIDDDHDRVQKTSHKRYFLPRVDIKDYNVLIDGRNFYNQNISDELRKYDEVRNIMTGRGGHYTTGSLLDYAYHKNHYKLIACDLQQQKVLDSDPKSIQQIEFIFKLDNNK